MNRFWTKCLALVTVLFSAAAFSQEPAPFDVYLEGVRVTIENKAKLVKPLTDHLQKYGVGRNDVVELVAALDKGSYDGEVPSIFRGLEGLPTILAARIVLMDEDLEVKGRLRDYIFDDPKKAGHLAVDVTIRDTRTNKTTVLHWDVDMPDGAYKVVPRKGKPGEQDPFPMTIMLPPEKLDPQNDDSIWKRDLDHKLFASGETIKVRHVYRQVDGGPIERLRPENYPWLYESTPDSCIDMMFKDYPPALQLPPQRFWCLGRCRHPYIMNSS